MKRLPPSWPLWVGLLVSAALYAPLLPVPFLWDDQGTIAMNRPLGRPRPASDYLSRNYFAFSAEQSWRPLATATYEGMIRAFGKRPLPMRALQLLLHAAVGLLLAALLRAAGLAPETAFWGAALFLVHPAHTETLMCVAFNEELLCALGILAMLWAHLKDRYAWAAAAFAAALLSKETGAVGLPLAVLFDALQKRQWRAKAYALYAAPLAVYLWAWAGPLHGPGGRGGAFALPAWERAYYALSGVGTAVRVFVLPLRLRIEYFALPPAGAFDAALAVTGTLLLLGAWGWLAWRLRKSKPAVAALLLWPVPFLLLTSNVIPVQVLNMRLTAERWFYLPYLGAAGAAAYGLSRRPAAAALVLALWAGLGWMRLADWSGEERLWSSLAKVYPWCAKAQEGLGEAFERQDKPSAALAAYRRALELRQTREDRVLLRYADLSQDGLVRWESPTLQRGLGRTYLKLGRIPEADESFLRASALDPRDGYTYGIMAYAYAERGDFPKARAWIERGLREVPGDAFLLKLKPDAAKGKLTFRAAFH